NNLQDNSRELRALQNEVAALNRQLGRRQSFSPTISPVIPVQGGNNNRGLEREIDNLREEVMRLRDEQAKSPVADTAAGYTNSRQPGTDTIYVQQRPAGETAIDSLSRVMAV